jgi:hypothetical protein
MRSEMVIGGVMFIVMVVLSVLYIGDTGWQWIAGSWAVFIFGSILLSAVGMGFAFVWMLQALVAGGIYLKGQT